LVFVNLAWLSCWLYCTR